MKNRTIQYAALVFFIICLLSHPAFSQTRRRPTTKQNSAKTQQLLPLTLDQKRIVSNFIARANSFELIYQTDQFEYALKAEGFASFLRADDIKQFPAGPIKTYLVAMVYGYGDVGILLGMLTHTGFSDAFYSAQAATTGRDGRPQRIEEIGKRWNINVMQIGLNQAQRRIFNNASTLKGKLSLLLSRTPTAILTSPGSKGSDWIFPKPGMQCRYSSVTKTEMCDLGDNIFAGHIELAPGVPAVAIVFPLAVPVPKEELSDADVAIAFASKVVKLHPVLSEARLDQEKENEHRFRTADGKVLIVALATDRRSAIIKFEWK
ncbi:MAG TPA: hypothetical protein VF544_14070 [Pyrinomonadaceae bacterium]